MQGGWLGDHCSIQVFRAPEEGQLAKVSTEIERIVSNGRAEMRLASVA
jgi:hypothetical protein